MIRKKLLQRDKMNRKLHQISQNIMKTTRNL